MAAPDAWRLPGSIQSFFVEVRMGERALGPQLAEAPHSFPTGHGPNSLLKEIMWRSYAVLVQQLLGFIQGV